MLVKSPLTKQYDLSSVIDMTSGAAPLSGEVIDAAEKLWPNGNVKLTVISSPNLLFSIIQRKLIINQTARMGND